MTQKYDYIVEKFCIKPADFEKRGLLWKNICMALTDAKKDILEDNYYRSAYYDKSRIDNKYFDNRYYGYFYHIAFRKIEMATYRTPIAQIREHKERVKRLNKAANKAEGRMRNQLERVLFL